MRSTMRPNLTPNACPPSFASPKLLCALIGTAPEAPQRHCEVWSDAMSTCICQHCIQCCASHGVRMCSACTKRLGATHCCFQIWAACPTARPSPKPKVHLQRGGSRPSPV
jgi:hypothetical protein